MKIAIIGTGIAGNVAANRLARQHDITVYEADNRIGGHTHTVDVLAGGRRWAVDTGFIVYNDVTYPNFIALLDELGVDSQPSDMGFSVSDRRSGFEYSGASLNTLFAQRSNLLKPSFCRMLRDVLRFNREAPALLAEAPAKPQLNKVTRQVPRQVPIQVPTPPHAPADKVTLGQYLETQGYSRAFIEHYIVPMGAAIWSASPQGMLDMPVAFFIRFFHNHGLLSVNDRPTWRVIKGGSRRYVEKLVAGHRDRIRLNTPVHWIRRHPEYIEVKARGAEPARYDRVFLACHSDQALRLLTDPTPQEREVLGAIDYQLNEAVLHTDTALMPRRRRAWAAWNYHLAGPGSNEAGRASLTYNMNILQGHDAPVEFCVTLNNRAAIDPDRIIQSIEYAHPIFTERAIAAQRRQREINGARRTYFCGAYWRYGFHEDGVVSALNALEHFHEDLPEVGLYSDEQRYLLRAG